jgi:hypothetical protein
MWKNSFLANGHKGILLRSRVSARARFEPGRAERDLLQLSGRHLIRHGFAVPPSPQGEGYLLPSVVTYVFSLALLLAIIHNLSMVYKLQLKISRPCAIM